MGSFLCARRLCSLVISFVSALRFVRSPYQKKRRALRGLKQVKHACREAQIGLELAKMLSSLMPRMAQKRDANPHPPAGGFNFQYYSTSFSLTQAGMSKALKKSKSKVCPISDVSYNSPDSSSSEMCADSVKLARTVIRLISAVQR